MTFAGFIKGQNRKQKPMMGKNKTGQGKALPVSVFFNTT